MCLACGFILIRFHLFLYLFVDLHLLLILICVFVDFFDFLYYSMVVL